MYNLTKTTNFITDSKPFKTIQSRFECLNFILSNGQSLVFGNWTWNEQEKKKNTHSQIMCWTEIERTKFNNCHFIWVLFLECLHLRIANCWAFFFYFKTNSLFYIWFWLFISLSVFLFSANWILERRKKKLNPMFPSFWQQQNISLSLIKNKKKIK